MNEVKCPNCGAKSSAKMKFCGTCGGEIKIEERFVVPAIPRRKIRKPLFTILTVIVLLAAGVIATARIGVFPIFGNGTYETAEANFFKLLTENISGDKGYKIDFDAGYTPSEQMILEGAYPENSDLSYSGSLYALAPKFLADVTADIAGTELRGVGVFDGQNLAFSLPDLSNYHVQYTNNGVALDDKALKTTFTNLIKEYFKLTKKIAEIEKGVELSSGSATVKCDQYTFDFNGEDLSPFITAAIKEIRKNKNFIEFIEHYRTANNIYLYRDYDFEQFLDYLDDSFDDFMNKNGNKRLLRMTVWVKNNMVIARKIDKIYEADDFVISYQFLLDGKNANLEAVLQGGNNSDSYKITGNFEKQGSAWDGDIRLRYGFSYPIYSDDWYIIRYDNIEQTLRLNIDGFKITDKKFVGEFRISGEFGEYRPNISAMFEINNNRQIITLNGRFGYSEYAVARGWGYSNESYDIGKAALSYSLAEIKKIDYPVYDRDYAVYGKNKDDEYGRYILESQNRMSSNALEYLIYEKIKLDDNYDSVLEIHPLINVFGGVSRWTNLYFDFN